MRWIRLLLISCMAATPSEAEQRPLPFHGLLKKQHFRATSYACFSRMIYGWNHPYQFFLLGGCPLISGLASTANTANNRADYCWGWAGAGKSLRILFVLGQNLGHALSKVSG